MSGFFAIKMSSTNPAAEEHLSQAQVPSDDDATSSSGTSSSESESECESSDDEYEGSRHENQTARTSGDSSIPNVTGRQKPQIHRIEGGSDLLARLSAFLPKMKDANETLEKEIAEGRGKDLVLDSVDEGAGRDYIEMNLGLGVLEEKRGGNDESSGGDDSDAEGSNKKSNSKGETDLLGKLMGDNESAGDKPSIEEMAE